MKKIISLILLITLVLALSGCSKEPQVRETVGDYEKCEYIGNYSIIDDGYYLCDEEELSIEEYIQLLLIEDIYYTQEEVDEMLEGLYDLYIEENEQDIAELKYWCIDVWLDVPDDIMSSDEYYADYDCIDMLEWYGENWEELYYLMENQDYLVTYILTLEARIEELEKFSYEFSWLDYNAELYNFMNERLELYFYDDFDNTKYFFVDVVIDFENSQLIINTYHNELLIEERIESFTGTMLDLINLAQEQTFDDNINYLYF